MEWENILLWTLADALDSGIAILRILPLLTGTVYKTKNLRNQSMITSCCRTYEELQAGQEKVCGKLLCTVQQYGSHFPENVW